MIPKSWSRQIAYCCLTSFLNFLRIIMKTYIKFASFGIQDRVSLYFFLFLSIEWDMNIHFRIFMIDCTDSCAEFFQYFLSKFILSPTHIDEEFRRREFRSSQFAFWYAAYFCEKVQRKGILYFSNSVLREGINNHIAVIGSDPIHLFLHIHHTFFKQS